MTKTSLDAARHRDLKLGALPDMAHSKGLSHAVIGLEEIALALADFPVLLMKEAETGRFNLVTLFGLSAQQNLYVVNERWQATYVPLAVMRYPFLIGDEASGEISLGIDEAASVLSNAEGTPLFDGAGTPTQVLENIITMVRHAKADFEAAQDFLSVLSGHGLIRPFEIVLHMADGAEHQVEGLYGIGRTLLQEAPDEVILDLRTRKYLEPVYGVISSLVHLNRLQQLSAVPGRGAISNISISLQE